MALQFVNQIGLLIIQYFFNRMRKGGGTQWFLQKTSLG